VSADETCDHHSVIAAPEGAQEPVFQPQSARWLSPTRKESSKYWKVLRIAWFGVPRRFGCLPRLQPRLRCGALSLNQNVLPSFLVAQNQLKQSASLTKLIDTTACLFLIEKDHCGSDQPVLTLPTSVPSPSAKRGGELVELPSGELINRHMGRTSRPTPCPSLVVTGAAGQEEVDIRVC